MSTGMTEDYTRYKGVHYQSYLYVRGPEDRGWTTLSILCRRGRIPLDGFLDPRGERSFYMSLDDQTLLIRGAYFDRWDYGEVELLKRPVRVRWTALMLYKSGVGTLVFSEVCDFCWRARRSLAGRCPLCNEPGPEHPNYFWLRSGPRTYRAAEPTLVQSPVYRHALSDIVRLKDPFKPDTYATTQALRFDPYVDP